MQDNYDVDEINAIAKQIEDYLSEHPNAADSLEGIARWWLTRQQYERRNEIVHKALQVLLEKGTVLETTRAGNTVYVKRIAPDSMH